MMYNIDHHLNIIRQWASLNVKNRTFAKKQYSKLDIKKCISKVILLSYIAHISLVNSVVDSFLCQGLCLSLFENYYSGPREPFFIFSFIVESFHLKCNTECKSQVVTNPFKRGEYLFKISRALHLYKGPYDILTLIFVSICRCYDICSRIVVKYPYNTLIDLKDKHTRKLNVWSEVYDTKSKSWIHLNFLEPKYNGHKYEYKSLKYNERLLFHKDIKDSTFVDNVSKKSYLRGYTLIQRDNKIFVYNTQNGVNISTIILLPFVEYRLSKMLYLREYPFETERDISDILNDFSPSQTTSTKPLFIISSNILGIISDITLKYSDRCLNNHKNKLYCWINETIDNLNSKRTSDISQADLKVKLSLASLLEKSDDFTISEIIRSRPLPATKSKYINHPYYILKSQVPKNRIIKPSAKIVSFIGDDYVYLKKDLEYIRTRYSWYKLNRAVVDDAVPVSTRLVYNRLDRKHKNVEYFSESQTRKIDEKSMIDGIIPTTIYNNVDLSGEIHVPKGAIYIKGNYPVCISNVAKSIGLSYKNGFSSFTYAKAWKPNYDGIVIDSKDLDNFLSHYNDYVKDNISNEFEAELENCRTFWKNLFKTLLSEPNTFEYKPKKQIKRLLEDQVDAFLSRLDK